MNLLAKRAGWLILSAAILFWGCKEDVGIELPPDVQRTEVKYAEFTLPVTNVYFDSLRTDSRGVTFLGEYSDAIYGTTSSSVFTEYRLKQGSLSDEITVNRGTYEETIQNIEFESAFLSLDVNNSLSNDSQVDLEVEISTLADSLYADGLYLRDSSIPIDQIVTTSNTSLARIDTINYGNGSVHTIKLSLSDNFGESLISKFEDEGTGLRPLGLMLKAVNSNGILSFDMASDSTQLAIQMRGQLYDTLGNVKKDTLFNALTFSLADLSANYFSKIDRDRSGSNFVLAEDKMITNDPSGIAYYNVLAGIFPTIDLNPLIEFSNSESGVLFNQVILEIPTLENPDYTPDISFTQFYFSKESDSEKTNVNWPESLTSPNNLATIMFADAGYSNGRDLATFNNDTISTNPVVRGFQGSPNVFTQNIYDNVRDDFEGIDVSDRPAIRGYMSGVNRLILLPGQSLLLGRNVIDGNSVKLKVYYTQLKE